MGNLGDLVANICLKYKFTLIKKKNLQNKMKESFKIVYLQIH